MPKMGKVVRLDDPRPGHIRVDLPNNGLPVVLVRPGVIEGMWEHADRGRPLEVYGFILGYPVKDPISGATATYMEEIVPARATGTPTYVTAHPESFVDVDKARLKSGTILVGYYHSHPGITVFQSNTDESTFTESYKVPYKVAIVVDPTRTSPEHLNPHDDWIGYFGWNEKGEIARLPGANVHVVVSRPPESAEERAVAVERPQPPAGESQRQRLAEATAALAYAVASPSLQLDEGLPFVVIAPEAQHELSEETDGNTPKEGLLLGVSGTIGSREFVCVTGRTPVALEALDGYEKAMARARAGSEGVAAPPLSELAAIQNGSTIIGLYGEEERVMTFLSPPRKFAFFQHRSIEVPRLARWSEKYFLVATRSSEPEAPTPSFSVLQIEDARLISLPERQILIASGD